jgi:hypothetical protein
LAGFYGISNSILPARTIPALFYSVPPGSNAGLASLASLVTAPWSSGPRVYGVEAAASALRSLRYLL